MRATLFIALLVSGVSAFAQTSSQVRVINTLDQLLDRVPVGSEALTVLGRTAPGDSGGARLFYSTNALPRGATNLAHSFATSASNVYWSSADWDAPVQDVRWFGASSSAVDNRAALQAAINYCVSGGYDLDGPDATFVISGSLSNLHRVLSPARWDAGGITISDGTTATRYVRNKKQSPSWESPFLSARLAGLTNLWTIGDSHTAGQLNIAGTSNWLSGGFMLTNYRYPNLLASRHSLNLTNLAVSGSAVSQGNPGTTGADLSSTLWQLSQVGPAWRGVMTVMHGYNDGYAWQDIASVQTWMESAQAASIAAAFSTNWAGPTGTNWYGAAVTGWTNGGTLYDEGVASKVVFPVSGALSANRSSILLTSGQSWGATLSGKIGLIFERWHNGGIVAIKTNGGVIAQQYLDTTGNGYAPTTRRLPSLHVLTLDSSTPVAVESLSGTNVLLGVVWIGSPEDAAGKRLVMSASPPLGDYTIRSDGMIGAIGNALFRAGQRWRDYPIWLTFAGADIDPKSDVYSTDTAHPGPAGHVKFADGFEAATPASAVGAQAARSQIESPQLRSSGGLQVYGGAGTGPDYSRSHGGLSFLGGYGTFLDSLGPGIGSYSNLIVRARNAAFQQGAVSVLGASPVGALPTTPGIHLSIASGDGYFDTYDYGTATYYSSYYRAKNHRFTQGSLSVSSATTLAADYLDDPAVHLSYSGGMGYLDTYDFSTATFYPINYRSLSHRFNNGSLSVLSATTLSADCPQVPGLHFSYGSGVGYVTAYDYGTSDYKQLLLRGSVVQVPTGPFQVIGGVGSGYPTNFGVVLFTDGTNAFVRAAATNGYVPLGLQGSAINLQIAGTTRASVDGSYSNNVTPLMVWDATSNALKRVNIGAEGTGPGGGRALFLDGTPGGTNAASGGGTGDVSAAGTNTFTGPNAFTNLLTARGGVELTNYYLRVTGPSAGGRILPSDGEGMELLYDSTNWVYSTGSSGRGEIQVYDRGGSTYGDFRFNARNVGFYGAGTLVLLTTNGQARVTGNLFVNNTNVMDAVAGKQASDSDLTDLASAGSVGSGHFVRSNAPTMRDPTFLGASTFSSLTVTTLTASTVSGNGSGLTNLDAGNISSGTLSTSRYTRTGVPREIWVPASAMNPGTSDPPTAATNVWGTTTDAQPIEAWDFSASSTNSVFFLLTLPQQWNGSTVKAKVYWKQVTAEANTTNVWVIGGGSLNDGEAGGNTLGTLVTVLDQGKNDTNQLAISDASSAITIGGTPSAGHLTWFTLKRHPGNTSDNATVLGRLIGVLLQYVETATEASAW